MVTIVGMCTLQELFDTYESRVKKLTSRSVRSDRIAYREKLKLCLLGCTFNEVE